MRIENLNTKVVAIAASLLAACVASGGADDWTVKGNVPLGEFVIQLHRSAGIYEPENTLESCELAWKLGTAPEVDLRTTRDGVIVAFHDTHFNRVVKEPDPKLDGLGVADLTFAELSEIDVGSFRGAAFAGQRIPRISDIFEAMRGVPDREIYLDVKEVDLARLAGKVRAAGVGGQVIFTTTHHDFIREWKALIPASQTLNWIGGGEARVKARLEDLRKTDFDGVTQLQIHVRLNPDGSSVEPFNHSRAFIRELGAELRERGILFQALPWELSDRDVYWKLLDLGVASFATDYPKETLDAVREYFLSEQTEDSFPSPQ